MDIKTVAESARKVGRIWNGLIAHGTAAIKDISTVVTGHKSFDVAIAIHVTQGGGIGVVIWSSDGEAIAALKMLQLQKDV